MVLFTKVYQRGYKKIDNYTFKKAYYLLKYNLLIKVVIECYKFLTIL